MKNILISVLMLTAANAGAMQNLKYGALEINPLVSVQQSYDSNIYLTKDQRKSANINRTGLGVGLVAKVGSRLDLKGAYTLEFLSYSRAASVNNATHHVASLGAEARLPKSIAVKLEDSYAQTTDQATSQLTPRALRVQNTAALDIEAPIRGKFGFGLSAQHTYHNYLAAANSTLDRQETLVGGDVTYKLQPKTKLFLAYRYGTLAYKEAADEAGDSTYNNVDLGLTGNIAPKLVGTVKAGMQYRKYANDLATADNKINTGGYSAQLVWKPLQLTEVIFYGKRANVESSYVNSRFYTSTVADLTLSRQVRKIKAGLGFNYETIAYPEGTTAVSPKRLDTNTNVRVTAEYNIQKWLKADAGYTYKNRASNENAFEYFDNVFTLGVKALF